MFNKKNIIINELTQTIKEKDIKIEEKDKRLNQLEEIITEEQFEASKVAKTLKQMKTELEAFEQECSIATKKYNQEIKEHTSQLHEIKKKIVKNTDKLNIQSYGFYEPLFKDGTSEELKLQVNASREKQKEMLRSDTYFACNTNWTVDGSISKGTTLVKRMAKNYITSFNLMCDAITERVSVSNVQKTKDKIVKTFENINRQAGAYQIIFSSKYVECKLEELDLMYSVAVKKEEEREERKLQAQIIKEQKKVEQELLKQRQKLEKELKHYQNQIINGDETALSKIQEIEQQIAENDYRKENTLAGYVYIIENKSFGEEIYKIGVTRRLEPLDRIAELSNASVPFRFQPNCIIFSDNAFKLENDLHKEFAENRVNKANSRKEYFQVSLKEIERVIKEKYSYDMEFNYSPSHDEWLVSAQESNILGIDEDDDED